MIGLKKFRAQAVKEPTSACRLVCPSNTPAEKYSIHEEKIGARNQKKQKRVFFCGAANAQ